MPEKTQDSSAPPTLTLEIRGSGGKKQQGKAIVTVCHYFHVPVQARTVPAINESLHASLYCGICSREW